MKTIPALLCCLVFSGLAFAKSGGGSQVTVPYIICMQDGKMISTTAIPVTECNKRLAQKKQTH